MLPQSDLNEHPHPDEPRVTQKDVAELAGVSRGIVSYVINNGPRPVAPETRERVLRAIAALDYRPNKHAQQLMREQWGSVAERDFGLILPSVGLFHRPYYGSILAGIYETAHARHCRIRFIRFFDELENPALFNELIHRAEISGLILMSLDQCVRTDADRERVARIRERMDNIVCLEWHTDGLPSVSFDRAAAAQKATNHLLSLNHERIAFLGQEDERLRGYHQARLDAGLPPETQMVFYAHDLESGYQEAASLLEKHPLPTALVAGSDEVAFGILRRLREHHIAVPQQLAMVSIDNIPMAAYAAPPLTTVEVPKMEMGRAAVELLVNYDSTNPVSAASTLLPVRLVVRDSCGAESSPSSSARHL